VEKQKNQQRVTYCDTVAVTDQSLHEKMLASSLSNVITIFLPRSKAPPCSQWKTTLLSTNIYHFFIFTNHINFVNHL